MKKQIEDSIRDSINYLMHLNHEISGRRQSDLITPTYTRRYKLQKVLVANRGEIAKRFFLALHEEGIPSVAVVTDVDKGQSWYEFADEVVFIGNSNNYGKIPIIIAAALLSHVNAIYSGYGFLSENAEFVETIEKISAKNGNNIIFMGPCHKTIRLVGNKINARALAHEHSIPLFESSNAYNSINIKKLTREAEHIGFPVIVKLAAGGGGKGMYLVNRSSELQMAVESSIRIGEELYNEPSFYIEKFIKNPIHMEVQIFNGWAVGIRKCAVQRRNQKIIEESGHAFLDDYMSLSLLAAAEKIALVSGYSSGGGAGTIEFLIDKDTGKFGFMEVNTRLQVEYAVTDQSLGIDLAKWQILHYDGRDDEIIDLDLLKNRRTVKDHSIECRIYAEDPEYDYLPSPGTITELNLPTYNGIRCDFGFAEGDSILSMYDPMIGKIIAHGSTRPEAIIRLERALQELYIKGVKTNINQLLRIIRHPDFVSGQYTNNLLKENDYLNFKEKPQNISETSERRRLKPVIFGGLVEYLNLIMKGVSDFTAITSHESILDAPSDLLVPDTYMIEIEGMEYTIELLHLSLDSFAVFVNSIFNGKIAVNYFNDRCDDFIFTYGKSSYRIRVDRHPRSLVLRMKGESNKIDYYRMSVNPKGRILEDNTGTIYSPFQGTFVSLCDEHITTGAKVSVGDPLLILSAMKMETILYAPVSGTIEYIIEDGDLAKLILFHTPDGRKIGRCFQEGEILIKILPEDNKKEQKQQCRDFAADKITPINISNNRDLFEIILDDNYEHTILRDPHNYLNAILSIALSSFQNFLTREKIIERIMHLLKKFATDKKHIPLDETGVATIKKIFRHYASIKRLFSPVILEGNLSYGEQLSLFVSHGRSKNAAFSESFLDLIHEVLGSYGINAWQGRPDAKLMFRQYGFYLFKRAYEFCLDNIEMIKDMVQLFTRSGRETHDMYGDLMDLMELEQAERDDSLVKFIRTAIIKKHGGDGDHPAFPESCQNKIPVDDYYLNYCNISRNEIIKLYTDFQKPVNTGLFPEHLPEWAFTEINKKIDFFINTNHTIKILFSPDPRIVIYEIIHNETEHLMHVAFIYFDAEGEEHSWPGIGELLCAAGAILKIYREIQPHDENRIEIIVKGLELCLSHTQIKKGQINYIEFIVPFKTLHPFFSDHTINNVFVSIDVPHYEKGTSCNKTLICRLDNDSIKIDILLEFDKQNPYYIKGKGSLLDQRLFKIQKWPIEIWAAECFDPGTMSEIRIPSIDDDMDQDTFAINRPVASKIIYGTIGGIPACFYMKDSRVSGGATGNREGLKYIAAAYIAYLKDWPLYIWNDSAGANIGEGVISLNRGGEGFMMNTLLAERADKTTFKKFIMHIPDERLRTLFKELDETFGLSFESLDSAHRIFQCIAVGIGSSAGLDVYGSSQASIQILLDSEESYRVLTGSNVIRSVIGEDISNYEIGGAKILGTWTGIVDLIARDKVQLINYIIDTHNLFSRKRSLRNYRTTGKAKNSPDGDMGPIVFDEKIIRRNVDHSFFWPFKEQYYSAETLIGGFCTIDGHRALIMGPRTHSGLRSDASIIRARALLKIAQRTASHQIFVFGKRWQQVPDYHENISMRSRLDFMNTLHKRIGVRINIITDPSGLKCSDINCAADAVIFISNKNISNFDYAFARMNSAFIVSSFDEAFDLSGKIIGMIDPLVKEPAFLPPVSQPAIPEDMTIPYDMLTSVIVKTFDLGSFIEFFREMNDPVAGPHLITGLAKLEGTTVGIIADQPLIQGGGADAAGTEKFRFFTEFLNKNSIPLVMLSNSSGFVPGSKQERYRIQAIGAESLDMNILGEIPVVSVVLNQNYGGRLIQAFNKFLRPGIVYLALEKSVMAVIGADVAFDLLYGKKFLKLYDEGKKGEAEEFKVQFIKQYLEKARGGNDAVKTGLVDWTIPDVSELRTHLLRGLGLAIERCNNAFGTSHHL